jgi:hypothetical protein
MADVWMILLRLLAVSAKSGFFQGSWAIRERYHRDTIISVITA